MKREFPEGKSVKGFLPLGSLGVREGIALFRESLRKGKKRLRPAVILSGLQTTGPGLPAGLFFLISSVAPEEGVEISNGAPV